MRTSLIGEGVKCLKNKGNKWLWFQFSLKATHIIFILKLSTPCSELNVYLDHISVINMHRERKGFRKHDGVVQFR